MEFTKLSTQIAVQKKAYEEIKTRDRRVEKNSKSKVSVFVKTAKSNK